MQRLDRGCDYVTSYAEWKVCSGVWTGLSESSVEPHQQPLPPTSTGYLRRFRYSGFQRQPDRLSSLSLFFVAGVESGRHVPRACPGAKLLERHW